MAHKFAHRWSVFTVNYNVTPPQLVDRGTMDLTTMDDNGVLANGTYHERPTGQNHAIRGSAHEIIGVRSLVLSHADEMSRYQGILVADSLGNMTIAGSRLIRVAAVKGRDAALDQIEEPWIITKP